MPYIAEELRAALRPKTRVPSTTPGELNFQITELLRCYVRDNGLSYQTINDCLGALDGAGKEFYRRVAVPYEDTKIAINGDVYDG